MANLPVEIKFAQNLAGNEKKVRDKAVKKLRKYLKAKSSSKKDGFTAEDFLKIWKGLHYCMWMQDKSLLQEELGTTLSQLVHDLSTIDAQLLFVKVFFITISREWNSIDVWRLDKFLMLVRNILNESLNVIKKLKWDAVHLYQLIHVFYEHVMNPDTDSIPDGLRIHFADIYLDEVEKVADKKLGGRQLLTCLVPFIKFLQKSKNHVLKRVLNRVFDPIIACAVEKEKIKQGKKDTNEDEDSVPYMSLKFDFQLISDHIFDVSQQDCVLGRNRPVLYGIVKKLQDVQKGVLPVMKEIVIPEGVSNKDVHLAVNRLVSFDIIKKKKNKKNKKEKNNGYNNERNENHDPNSPNVSTSEPGKSTLVAEPATSTLVVGEKRKHSLTEESGLESMTKIKKRKQSADADTEDGKTKNKKKNKKALGKVSQTPNASVPGKSPESLAVSKETTYTVTVDRIGQTSEKIESVAVPKTRKSQVVQIEAQAPSSLSKKIGVNSGVKTGKRRRSESDVTALKSTTEISQPNTTPKIVVNTPSANLSNSKAGEEKEIEIWVPNKKYKGNQEANRRSSFAVFDQTGPPSAFVRRAHSKLKQTPSTLKKASSTRSASKNSKRVSFDLKKNMAQAFKDSLKTPVTPFNPTVQPDQGILKTPSPNMPNSSQNSTSTTSQDPQTPVTRQAKRQAMSANRATTKTSVVSVGFEGVKMTSMRRMKAADFFL